MFNGNTTFWKSLVSIFKVVREQKADGRTGCIIQGKRLGDSHGKVKGGGRIKKEKQEGQQTEKGMAKGHL